MQSLLLESNTLDKTKLKPFHKEILVKLKAFTSLNQISKSKKFLMHPRLQVRLSLWIRAVIDTYGALLVVEPKKLQLN
jgi:hypothetical protein